MAQPDQTSRTLLRWLWRSYLGRHFWMLLLATFFMALEGSMLGLLSWMMKPMFDSVFLAGDESALWWVGLVILGIFLVRAVASVIQKVILTRISQQSEADMRGDLLSHLMRLDVSFHQLNAPGTLMQRVIGDVSAVSKVWNAIITGAGRDLVAVVVLFGVAMSVDWRWTVVALIGVPFLVLPSLIAQRFVRRHSRTAHQIAARQSGRLDEVFHGIVPVKLNRLEDYQARHYAKLNEERVEIEVTTSRGKAAIPGLIDAMSGVGFLGVLLYGGGEIISGEKTVGEFMAFFTALGFAFEPLRRLGTITGTWEAAAAGIERVMELLALEPVHKTPTNPQPAPVGTPEITLNNVHLSYGDTPVLQGTSLTARAGKTTALVGPSGAGKSTIFNVLTRLTDPQSGVATLGGVPVTQMALTDLRDLFSVVSQDALLFDETLRENILLGRKDVSEAQLKKTLDAAHVSDFLEQLPNGLDTAVGPRGSALSGGQRQRVAIARALLRDTPILLLDEATSALDAQSEAVVQAALERLSQGRTTLVIAHRLSTIRTADQIVVMEAGKVVEQGTHDSLIALDGTYASLHKLQAKA
ncbi:ABC transporter ATP-binding protein [Planktotalea sp.]|uniref:ABC transporter ATP-binding protein n=1 Tax=Planktotalea sp. TaxID=2029877 RepID=UPI0025D745B6|nr:ABC transporter ATP-binding protein [Planktotalea sp.]